MSVLPQVLRLRRRGPFCPYRKSPMSAAQRWGAAMENFGFWAVAGGLVVAVAALMLRALSRPPEGQAAHPDLKVYRDQLAEVERDLARGVIGPDEAARLRVEVSRRLLEADRALQGAAAARALPLLPVAGVVAVLLAGGAGIYWHLGAPGYPDMPLAARLAASDTLYRTRPSQAEAEAQAPAPVPVTPDAQFADLMEKLRAAVAARPDDLRGLELLARNEALLGRNIEAARAQEHLVAILGDQATVEQHLTALEYLVVAAGGYVSPQAEAHLTRVLTTDPRNKLARYYAGLMFAQVGRPDRTFEFWEPLLTEGPADAPWIAPIRAALPDVAERAGLRYTPPDAKGPDAAAVAAAGEMSAEDRQAMIEGMVAQLEGRLMSDGGPEEEWQKLFNALSVLGQPERVAAALKAAETAFAADPAALERLRAAAGAAAGAAP